MQGHKVYVSYIYIQVYVQNKNKIHYTYIFYTFTSILYTNFYFFIFYNLSLKKIAKNEVENNKFSRYFIGLVDYILSFQKIVKKMKKKKNI